MKIKVIKFIEKRKVKSGEFIRKSEFYTFDNSDHGNVHECSEDFSSCYDITVFSRIVTNQEWKPLCGDKVWICSFDIEKSAFYVDSMGYFDSLTRPVYLSQEYAQEKCNQLNNAIKKIFNDDK